MVIADAVNLVFMFSLDAVKGFLDVHWCVKPSLVLNCWCYESRIKPNSVCFHLQRASIVEGVGARPGLWLGLGIGRFRLVRRLRTVWWVFVLYERQHWLKQNPDPVLWRRDGWQHAEDIRRQQAEYWWTWVWQWWLSATRMWRLGSEYSFFVAVMLVCSLCVCVCLSMLVCMCCFELNMRLYDGILGSHM